MASLRFTGNAQATYQLNTITPANVNIGNTFTVTINGKSITFTATAATVANVTAGLVALLQASTAPAEFQGITWADNTTNITGTAEVAGVPFTQTSSASGGTATLTTAVTTAASGPNFWNVAANWSSGAVPVNGDDVYYDNTAIPILYGLANSGVALNSLTIRNLQPGAAIGLPKDNPAGYVEYFDTELAIGTTSLIIDDEASQRIKINLGSATACAIQVLNSGSGENGLPAVILRGTNASNTLEVTAGSVGIAIFGAETANLATVRNTGGSLLLGPGVAAITTAQQAGGTTECSSNITTLTMTGGTFTILGAATVTTLTVTGGTLQDNSSGTFTTVTVGDTGELDASGDLSPQTITNLTLNRGGSYNDPFRRLTITNKVTPGSDVSGLSAA